MNVIQSNIFAYHLIALASGVAYYFGFLHGFNSLGPVINPIFAHYQPDQDSLLSPMLINYALAFIGSILPAIVAILIIHHTLNPNSKLFIFVLSAPYLALSIWSIQKNYNDFLGLIYLYSHSGKVLGGLTTVWGVSLLYLRSKPNKYFKADAQKAARPLN